MVQKVNQPKGRSWGPLYVPRSCNFKKQVCEKCSVQFWRGPWLSCAVLQVIMWKLTNRRHDWWRDTQWDQKLYEITLHTCHNVKVNFLKSLLSLQPNFTLVLAHIKPYQFSDWVREFRENEHLPFFSYYFSKLRVFVTDFWFFSFLTNYSVLISVEAPVAQW